MNWYKIAKGRGLYNQYQSDSSRQQSRGFGGLGSLESDRYNENDTVEGEHVSILRRMFKEHRFNDFASYLDKLRTDGHSEDRITSMQSRASAGVKI